MGWRRDLRRWRAALGGESGDAALAVHLADVFKRVRVNVVLDVGANTGQYGRLLRRAGYAGPIHSFEPVPAIFEQLRKAAADDPQWTCHRLALGAERERRRIRVPRFSSLASFREASTLALDAFGQRIVAEEEIEVEIHRMDTFLPPLLEEMREPRVFLKMDTQGFDLEVLRGAEGILDPVIGLQSELSILPLYREMPDYVEALTTFRGLGFEISGLFPILSDRRSSLLMETDCVMLRRSAVGRTHLQRPELPRRTSREGDPRVSALVIASEDSDALRTCLARVRSQADALGAEVLLVVSGSVDMPDALRKWCDRILYEPTSGRAHALNAGVDASRGEVIAFTDDRAEPEDGWLRAVTRPLLEADRPEALVGVGARVIPRFLEAPPDWYGGIAGRGSSSLLGPRHDVGDQRREYALPRRGEVVAPLGIDCAYRREIFSVYSHHEDLGPHPETGLPSREGPELAFRLLLDGFRILYEPEAVVHHPVQPERTTAESVGQSLYWDGVGRMRMLRALGLPLPESARLRRRLRRRSRALGLRRLLDPQGALRRKLRNEGLRGMLDELEGRSPSEPVP